MLIAIFAFCVIFLLIVSVGMLLFYRQAMMQRMSSVIAGHAHRQPKSIKDKLQESGFSITGIVEQFDRVVPKSVGEVSVAQQRLIRAGYRDESAVKLLYGAKGLVPLALCVVGWATGLGAKNPFFVYFACLALGYLAPDFWLGRQIKKRQNQLRRGLPDVLDLLVICMEAGLSLDQATMRTSQELKKAQPALSEEFGIVVLEQGAGHARSDAWRNLSERTDVDCLRNLVSMLIQAEQFGTSVARTLRTHSDTLRTQRIQQVEEIAAKTTIKLLFPLVLFIFPSLFLVTLGPAMIVMQGVLKDFLKH